MQLPESYPRVKSSSHQIDHAVLRETAKQSVQKMKELTAALRAVIEHEQRVAGDLLGQREQDTRLE